MPASGAAGAAGRVAIRWLPQREARAFVKLHHSHHGPMRGAILCLGAYDGERLCAVAAIGRPSARMLDQRRDTAEVTRHCTDRTPNVAAKLYAQCRRVAQALGFDRCITYTLATESGVSLKVAGWRRVRDAGGGSWSRPSRTRTDKAPVGLKHLWEAGYQPSQPATTLPNHTNGSSSTTAPMMNAQGSRERGSRMGEGA